MFRVGCTSDKIWNLPQLLRYLSDSQGGKVHLRIDPEAICLRTVGLYDILDCFSFESVSIDTCNPFETHGRYVIDRGRFDFWFDHRPQIQSHLQHWNGRQLFLCLYGRPTAARLGLAGWLYERHRSLTHLHFSAGIHPNDLLQFELDKLLSYDHLLIEPVGRMIPDMPLLCGSNEKRTAFGGYDYTDPLTNLYQDILVDVVVESHVSGNTFFPTEKIARAIWMKKPFVVFASKNFLLYLRQMGFRSFNDFWSEDYDGFEKGDRLSRMLQTLDWIAGLSHAQLETMWYDMRYSLDHNFDLLSKKQYRNCLTKVD